MSQGNRFYVRAYGCQMNQYEAELVREILGRDGYSEVGTETDADVVLLLTCSVRQHAEQRALGRLQNLRGLKRDRPELVLAVLGCMAQARARELANGLGADIVLGPDDYRQLPELIRNYRATRVAQLAARLSSECYEGIVPRSTHPVNGMVAVMRGCNNYCTYCIVPFVRGAERSKPAGAVLAEVQVLVQRGLKDITLVGQNVLAYRDGEVDFPELLRQVAGRAGSTRVRFLTSHPKDVTPALARVMRDAPNVCEHVHLPLQSGSNRILAAMNRRYTREEYVNRVQLLRDTVPGSALTTDILVAFPGESDDDYAATLQLVEALRFDFAYMYRYSPRPGTRAAELANRVPDEVARGRLSRLIAVQNEITRAAHAALLGRRVEVLVDSRRGAESLGRTRDDKMVAVKSPVPLGTLLNVEITGIHGWTPVGVPVDEREDVTQSG